MDELQLKDIHLPDALSIWPLALGWWLVIAIVLILIIALFYWVKRTPKIVINKVAKSEFEQIKAGFLIHSDNNLLIQHTSQFIRKLLLTTSARKKVASISGELWKKALQELNPKHQLSPHWVNCLTTAPYQKQVEFNAQDLIQEIDLWLKTMPKVTR